MNNWDRADEMPRMVELVMDLMFKQSSNWGAPTVTCIPAYTGRMTLANQSTRFRSEFQ